MLYIISLIIMLSLYIVGIIILPKWKNIKYANLFFCLTPFILYLIHVFIIYLQVGIDDWNFHNVLPTANISPFLFSTLPLSLILPKKAKDIYYTLISIIFLGMLLSPIFTIIQLVSINYAFHLYFFLDYLSHILISLWGIYLVRTKQVELKVKKAMISSLPLIGICLLMLLLNVIFGTNFFGLNLNGNHSIYNLVLTDNSYLSALIYFSFLIIILIGGYIYQLILEKINNSMQKKKPS